MNRRHFVKQTTLASAGMLLSGYALGGSPAGSFPMVRTEAGKRKFTSPAVEKLITEVTKNIGNKEIAWLFQNCFPNTLDTTVDFTTVNGQPDTYVITGDIDAMWLRDSSAQVWPYLRLCNDDMQLAALVKGVIYRQVKCILKDPYANAFYKDGLKVSEWHNDETAMQPGIHERKWEIDSLCYPIRLAHGYWKTTGDTSPFDEHWIAAMQLVIKTFIEQQRWHDKGPYSFMRGSKYATDSIPMGGYGYPVKPNGLICSMFRPSDDATIYPYLIPSNMFALQSLADMAEMITALKTSFDMAPLNLLVKQISSGLKDALIKTDKHGLIYTYEINGFGSSNLMDDANVPSLLSLPYLIPKMKGDLVCRNTREFVLSAYNPFFFKGKAGEGIGGPHVGIDMIWPISIIMRGITSEDDKEIKLCLNMLQLCHNATGFMHEAFHKDDASKFSRPRFAWANTLWGEFIWKVYMERRGLLG